VQQQAASPETAALREREPEFPDWVTETPDEPTYRLEMTEWSTGNNEDVQRIDLSRSEFIELKRSLARLRQRGSQPDGELSRYLEAVKLIYKRDRGDETPGEQLILDLLLAYAERGRIHLNDAERAFKAFRLNWGVLAETAKTITTQYPDLAAASGR